jgi:hypothetical protein
MSQAAIVFGQNFASWLQKKRGCEWCKGVFWENMDPSCHIQTIGFGMSPTCSKIPKLFYFPLTCRQIWLSPLLDGSQPMYVTNLRKKKTLVLVDIKILCIAFGNVIETQDAVLFIA